MLAVILLIWQQQRLTAFFGILASPDQVNLNSQPQAVTPELGRRHQLNYQQWVDILKQEAKVAADETSPAFNHTGGRFSEFVVSH